MNKTMVISSREYYHYSSMIKMNKRPNKLIKKYNKILSNFKEHILTNDFLSRKDIYEDYFHILSEFTCFKYIGLDSDTFKSRVTISFQEATYAIDYDINENINNDFDFEFDFNCPFGLIKKSYDETLSEQEIDGLMLKINKLHIEKINAIINKSNSNKKINN